MSEINVTVVTPSASLTEFRLWRNVAPLRGYRHG